MERKNITVLELYYLLQKCYGQLQQELEFIERNASSNFDFDKLKINTDDTGCELLFLKQTKNETFKLVVSGGLGKNGKTLHYEGLCRFFHKNPVISADTLEDILNFCNNNSFPSMPFYHVQIKKDAATGIFVESFPRTEYFHIRYRSADTFIRFSLPYTGKEIRVLTSESHRSHPSMQDLTILHSCLASSIPVTELPDYVKNKL